jgi:hypothetical protein
MDSKKFIMHVEGINEKEEILYVVGHEIMPDDTRSGLKYESSFHYAWLQIMLGDNGFNELKKLGRMFYFYEGERNRIDLPFFEPLSEEDKEEIKKRADEWAEKLTEE